MVEFGNEIAVNCNSALRLASLISAKFFCCKEKQDNKLSYHYIFRPISYIDRL
jgi:hypothetical protein